MVRHCPAKTFSKCWLSRIANGILLGRGSVGKMTKNWTIYEQPNRRGSQAFIWCNRFIENMYFQKGSHEALFTSCRFGVYLWWLLTKVCRFEPYPLRTKFTRMVLRRTRGEYHLRDPITIHHDPLRLCVNAKKYMEMPIVHTLFHKSTFLTISNCGNHRMKSRMLPPPFLS